jgi:AcrR family transcriptional regulator
VSAESIALRLPAEDPPTRPSRKAGPLLLPLKQARAVRTRHNLVQAGRALLHDGGFDQVSIGRIAQLAGCSVGAFYFSFRDKEAFFRFLLDDLVAEVQHESQRSLAPEKLKGLDRNGVVRWCVEHFVATVRRHEGLVRTVIQHTARDPAEWQPMQAVGLWLSRLYAERLLQHAPTADVERVRHNALTGCHIVMGFVVNAVLHRGGPLNLHSPDLTDWLAHVLQSCLDRPRPKESPK